MPRLSSRAESAARTLRFFFRFLGMYPAIGNSDSAAVYPSGVKALVIDR
jgi:hypothetical protein